MSRRRFFVGIGALGVMLLTGVIAWRNVAFPRVSADYTAGNFSISTNGAVYGYDGQQNVLIGSFVLPDPATDTLLIDGAGNTVAAKNALTAFSSSNRMYDADNGDDLDATEAILSSSNITLDPADSVLVPSAAGVFTAIPTTESASLLIYIDQGATSGSVDAGEDVYRMVFSGTGGTVADGALIRTFENTATFFDVDGDNAIDLESLTSYSETWLTDADSDGAPSAGDSVLASGIAAVSELSSASNVCFDGSVANDAEYDVNEIVWLDVAGDCTSFSTGVDSILLGNSAPSGTSTEFGTEQEIGYFDADGSNTFTCSRAGTCEALFYSGVSGSNITTGSQTGGSNVFFDSSTEATDGIRTTGTAWDEASGLEDLIRINTLVSGGEPRYIYLDQNSDTTHQYGEDFFEVASIDATATTVTGQTMRLFDADERALMTPGNALATFTASTGAVVRSADTILSAGALNGTGTDRVVVNGNVLDAIPATNKYFDHDTSGSFAGTDDVVVDTDASGYYNADDILTLKTNVSGSGDDITDSYLTAINIYQRTGNTCAGIGTDTLLGSDVSSPFLNQAITLTKAPYAASDATASRTICVYANLADTSTHGKIWTLLIPATGATFASNVNSPTTDFTAVTGPIQFVQALSATMTATNLRIGATASYTFAYTLEDTVANANGLVSVTFPTGYGVSSAAVACTTAGSPISITPSISGQSVRATNASGGSVSGGTAISCTISNVTNPNTAGTTSAFTIGAFKTSTSRFFAVDVDNTATLHGGSSTGASTVSNTIALASPNGGESFAAGEVETITWSTTGTGISYVHLYYSADAGATWTAIASNEPNDGTYDWTVPSIASSTVLVKIEGTDLATIADDDTSDAEFEITGGSEGSADESGADTSAETAPEVVEDTPVEVPDEETPISTTLTEGEFIKLADASTVYGLDENLIRHPLMDAQTYFTYVDSFDAVLTVDEETFNQSTLGTPMLVNPGVILVQFDSSPTVYTVNVDSEGYIFLRPIPDEATVSAVITDDWAEHVIRLSDAAFPYYRHAEEPETVESLTEWVGNGALTDAWHLRYPDPTYDPDGDGAATWTEASWATDPYNDDTDGDGYDDKTEHDTGYSPLSNDTDGDGYTDVEELRSGHNPFLSWITELTE